MPLESKVRRISIVATGGSFGLELFLSRDAGEEPVGVKAAERTPATAASFQVTVMLSGKAGESRTKTSSGERRPRPVAEVTSSCFRVWPRLSAFPAVKRRDDQWADFRLQFAAACAVRTRGERVERGKRNSYLCSDIVSSHHYPI